VNETTTSLNWKDMATYVLFWSWNLIFLAFMVLGFAPRMLPDLFSSVSSGLIPLSYLIYAMVLSAIPLATMLLGLTVLRRQPRRLFALGYVVEGPLMLVLAIRFFIIRQATLAVILVLLVACLGMAAFLWNILDPGNERRKGLAGYLHLIGLTLMLLTSLYAAIWIAFYAVPILAAVLDWFGRIVSDLPGFVSGLVNTVREMMRQGLGWIPFMVLGFMLGLYTMTLFVLTPVAVPVLSLRAWRDSLRSLAERQGWLAPLASVALTVAVAGLLFFAFNRQPQAQAFALLEKPPDTPQKAQSLLAKQKSIRAGLLNAYLAPFRYVSAVGEVRHVSTMYAGAFNMPKSKAMQVEHLYEEVAMPLLYQPVEEANTAGGQDNLAFQTDPQQAAQLYQQFFDTPIVEGERPAIVQAVRSTWESQQAEAAWQAVDDREVHLMRQEVNIQEHGDWADVELYEVYENKTTTRQEVIYYFNLPESAVLTGVWLGNSADRDQRFAFQVAPRGAAQAVYRNETRVQQDPALLEQIGPRQYRLRVFPVPPLRITWDESQTRRLIQDAPPLHMWLTYQTMADGNSWPMPHLAVKRNVYWDAHTVRMVNGKAVNQVSDQWLPAAWLPASLPASQEIQAAAHRVDFPGGQSVVAVPADQVQLPGLPAGLRLALVLDRSRSMAEHADQVAQALSSLKANLDPSSAVDVYLTSSPYRGEAPQISRLEEVDPQNILYFGGQDPAELLAQFEALRSGRSYAAILVLTDSGGYELGPSTAEISVPDAPVWMVHMSSAIPLGYDDQTLEAVQASGGGVVGDLDEALRRLALSLAESKTAGASTGGLRDVVDGYVWTVLPGQAAATEFADVPAQAPTDGFSALAARRYILAETHRQSGTISQLDTLDQLQALAKEYSIVTPYSSMIVLVTTRQQLLLDQLSQASDRYQREYEDIKNTVPSTPTPLTGVPEPQEWLLMILAGGMLVWYAARRGLIRLPVHSD
jgi:putative PEP-CTERM system integral membrane protein